MKFTLKKSVSRSGLTAALSLIALSTIPSLAQADALAQAYLNITNFQFGYNTANVTATALPGVAINSSANFGGVPGVIVNTLTDSTATSGPNAGSFNTTTKVNPFALPPLNYAGGYASQIGNSAPLGGGANALTNAVVSLVPAGIPPNSSAGSNLVSQQFNVSVAGGPQAISVAFTGDQYIRAFLNAGAGVFLGGNAQGKTIWSLNISQQQGGSFVDVAKWDPTVATFLVPLGGFNCDGFAVSGCSSLSAFRLSNTVSAFNNPENSFAVNVGNFTSNFTLATGNYRFEISHDSQASARLAIPEPGTLALVGLSLVGLAAVGRRRAMHQTA